jgi:hypothetical protein
MISIPKTYVENLDEEPTGLPHAYEKGSTAPLSPTYPVKLTEEVQSLEKVLLEEPLSVKHK